LLDIIDREVSLSIKNIRSSKIPTWTRLFDPNVGKIYYHDLRISEDPSQLLRAAVSIAPYYFGRTRICGDAQIDGSIGDPNRS
jgi:hypothetical protein